ncbi:MAG TPA: hypothetical protein VIY47_09320, partial [Ignavibacteriaceae bacterium]
MNKKKIILTDADGVLVTWIDGFQKFMKDKGHELIPDTEHHYGISDRYHVSDEESRLLVREFNEGPYLSSLLPYKDSLKYIWHPLALF